MYGGMTLDVDSEWDDYNNDTYPPRSERRQSFVGGRRGPDVGGRGSPNMWRQGSGTDGVDATMRRGRGTFYVNEWTLVGLKCFKHGVVCIYVSYYILSIY